MATSPFSVTRFRIIFSVCWLIIFIDHVILLRWFGLSWTTALVDGAINDALLILACFLVIMMLHYYLPQKEKYFHLLTWCFLITVIVILITKVILKNIYVSNEEYIVFFNRSIWVRSSLDFLLLGCTILISVIWYNWQEQTEQETRKQDAEKLSKEAELFKLRQQLQPHFLFNSLNSISALTIAQPEKARHMINQLSEFLRGTLKKDEKQLNTLEEEMQYLELYLEIEKVRFGHRLQTNVICDEAALQLQLPSMLLQPVVENAIKFGLYDTTGEVLIKVHAKKIDNHLEVSVENPFDPETAQPLKGTG